MRGCIFTCPACSSPLLRDGRSFICINNHRYDISKEGYVNLLLANQKQSREPGDSKEMLDARKSFLEKGYYKPLARSVVSAIIRHKRHSRIISGHNKMTYCQRRSLKGLLNIPLDTSVVAAQRKSNNQTSTPCWPGTEAEAPRYTILDAGCGEGYYTDYISRNRYAGASSAIYGIDISKEGIKSASKKNSAIQFAVAGIYNIPAAAGSVDALINIFAPFNEAEFGRVLKDSGIIISVAPGEHHLYELKKNLYDEVYLNDEKFEVTDNFTITEIIRVKYELNIRRREDIENLLKMTPYYHKTLRERIESFIRNAEKLKTTADFLIRIIKKTALISQ